MKNNKGFTLIELLAVILVLSVISLIAVVAVNNIIKQAKFGAAQRNTEIYLKTAKEYLTLSQISDEIENIPDGTYTVSELEERGLESNYVPTSGKITISNGQITEMKLHVDNYEATYENEELSYSEWVDNYFVYDECEYELESLSGRKTTRVPCSIGTVKKGKKYRFTGDLYIRIDERLINEDGSIPSTDFYVRYYNVWEEDSIWRRYNIAVGEHHAKIDKVITAKGNHTNSALFQKDSRGVNGYVKISNMKLELVD